VSDQLRRVAFHESGHAVASTLCGDTPAVVSIRPSANHGGLTIHNRASTAPSFGPGKSAVLGFLNVHADMTQPLPPREHPAGRGMPDLVPASYLGRCRLRHTTTFPGTGEVAPGVLHAQGRGTRPYPGLLNAI
jgi:hypothetical protein